MSCNVFNRALYSLEIDTKAIQALKELPDDSYYFQVNGTPVYKIEELKPNQPFQIHFRLCGGKGGFGSLLKSFRIHRSTNQLMCRNLSGRRLCDVKEEERLRKWISKTAEREKEKQRKKKEKYEKLKNGNRTKHEFSDPEYLRKRDMVLDETEDAVEAGISVLKEAPSDEPGPSSSKPIEDMMEDSSSDSDSDFDLNGEVPLKKRKVAPVAYDLPEKKPKIAENLEIEPPTNQETPVEKKNLSAASAGKKFQLIVKNVKKDEEPAKKKQVEKEKAPSPPKDFPSVDLDSYNSVSELEALGLDHLKHALEARCLKCGGSLQERASRLFSVKGLAPEEYPKNIKAPVKKK